MEDLHVYEVLARGLPGGEPSFEGFLGMWPEGDYCYLFFDRDVEEQVFEWLKDREGRIFLNTYRLAYEQWQQFGSREVRVGPFLIRLERMDDLQVAERTCEKREVSRSFETLGPIPIRLDPGLVFGSGLHPTTKGCLLALADLFDRFVIKSVTDFGTGTGILAIGAGLLGAGRVIGIDCNPLAARVALKNVRANGLHGRVDLVVAGEPDVLRRPSDLLVMNLESVYLMEILQEKQWMSYRFVVLSGFIESQWKELESLIPPAFEMIYRSTSENWVTIAFATGAG